MGRFILFYKAADLISSFAFTSWFSLKSINNFNLNIFKSNFLCVSLLKYFFSTNSFEPMNNRKRPREFVETRITNYFKIEDKKYRLCYTPKNDEKKVSIQINHNLKKFIPFVKKIISLGKYNILKIYLKKDYIPDSHDDITKFIDGIGTNGYNTRTKCSSYDISMSQDTYFLICVIEKESWI